MDLQKIITEAGHTADLKGWSPEGLSFPITLALVHSELSEALEEFRRKAETLDDFDVVSEMRYEGNKPVGIPVELADVIIRIAHMADYWSIDLVGAVEAKLEYNRGRTFRHGGKVI